MVGISGKLTKKKSKYKAYIAHPKLSIHLLLIMTKKKLLGFTRLLSPTPPPQ